ncbi:MAG: ubiquinol-cytochrome c reductase iron-sulfur subunit [Gammaproteobacteria bacterium]|nr:ubiquinol-cytochrome c reductase iron-sulfur subunit [Gammaproteobacteria bacterium]
MSLDSEIRPKRRSFLLAAFGFATGFVVAALSIPSFQKLTRLWFRIANDPSTLTNVEVDIRELPPGETMAVTWKNRLVYVVRRTPEMLTAMQSNDSQLLDPDSEYSQQIEGAQNDTRSLNSEVLVIDGMCTHLGCPVMPIAPGAKDWLPNGGFYCGCHGGKFDLAGRVYNGTPVPQNLQVPPYFFKDENTIVIGGSRHISES